MGIFWKKMENILSYFFWENLDKLWQIFWGNFYEFWKKYVEKKGRNLQIFDETFE